MVAVSEQDPTRSGPSLESAALAAGAAKASDGSAGMITLSCNEMQMLALKAARGAGLEWGLAEEAGNAARWLAVRNLPGPAVLAAYLSGLVSGAVTTGVPACDASHWSAEGGRTLCPIATGASLCDLAGAGTGRDGERQLTGVASPVLLLPFLAEAARATGRKHVMTAGAVSIAVAPDGAIEGEVVELAGIEQAPSVCITTGGAASGILPSCGLPAIDAGVLKALDRLALRTCVPASEQSRSGAGSALSDND